MNSVGVSAIPVQHLCVLQYHFLHLLVHLHVLHFAFPLFDTSSSTAAMACGVTVLLSFTELQSSTKKQGNGSLVLMGYTKRDAGYQLSMIHYRMSHRLREPARHTQKELTVRRHHLKYVLNIYVLQNHCSFAIKVRVLEIAPATA